MPPSLKSPLSLEELLSPLPPGAKVLDLGCGGGSFDYSKYPLLEIRAVDEGIHEKVASFPANVQFTQGVASAIPERERAVDLVVANFAFEHFPDAVTSLREIDRVLRDEGFAWISMPNAGSFEDQLYRNLFAGGGHLQRPSFEWFIRKAYSTTSLKLISYLELPAGFTYLGETKELLHLTWAIVDALRRTAGVDARSRSGYILILQKLASAGPGFLEPLRSCSFCGSPAGNAAESKGEDVAEPWVCQACGASNIYPSSLQIARADEVSRALSVLWERYPEMRPERMREMMEERSRWALELEKQVRDQQEFISRLQKEFDERGRWGQDLDREVNAQREVIAGLQAEITRLQTPIHWMKYIVGRLWRRLA